MANYLSLAADLKNYTYWKMMGGPKTFKRDACPRYFACQADNPVSTALDQDKLPQIPLSTTELPVTFVTEIVANDSEFIVPDDLDTVNEFVTPRRHCVSIRPFSEEKFTQTKKLINSSKATQIKPVYRTVGVTAAPISCYAGASTCGTIETNVSPMDTFESDTESKNFLADTADPPDETCPVKIESLRSTIFQSSTRGIIEENPLLFIGVPKDTLTDVHELAKTPGISIEDIYLVMKKIRQNISNAVLSCYFGISESRVPEIFESVLPIIAEFYRQFIVWPSNAQIRLNLPAQFSKRYGQVQSIIDCFEIQIEHREDPDKHTIFKKGSTKYLISVTPDGMINYVSNGYPGLRSDPSIVEVSGYLDVLPNGVAVLADRAMKPTELALRKKKCTLIRPPIVLSGPMSSSVQPTASKQIDCVRTYVDEIVKQLREFKILGSHSTVEPCLLPYLDNAMVVAVGLTNLQRRTA